MFCSDIIHSDSGGLGKKEPIGDAGKITSQHVLIIAINYILSSNQRFFSKWHNSANARLLYNLLLTLACLGIFRRIHRKRSREFFHGQEVLFNVFAHHQRLRRERDPDGLRLSQDGERQLLLEDKRQLAIRNIQEVSSKLIKIK